MLLCSRDQECVSLFCFVLYVGMGCASCVAPLVVHSLICVAFTRCVLQRHLVTSADIHSSCVVGLHTFLCFTRYIVLHSLVSVLHSIAVGNASHDFLTLFMRYGSCNDRYGQACFIRYCLACYSIRQSAWYFLWLTRYRWPQFILVSSIWLHNNPTLS